MKRRIILLAYLITGGLAIINKNFEVKGGHN